MGTGPGSAEAASEDLARGIDPGSLGKDALGADIARAAEVPGPQPLTASCVRTAYEAIAAAGDHADGADRATLLSLRAGARAAADAARVADEIGAGAGAALRGAARAWYPYAVETESLTWQAGLGAFRETCETATEADQTLIVSAVEAAGQAAGDDDTATARAVDAFAGELKRRTSLGEDLPTAWSGAARHAAETAPEPVFQTVVDAVQGVLSR
ncbi:hypothetical protein [Promicromonospora sp. NPDC090134]|uniref:hypothetical protein n=1 Tax=Promicromonospora sp. NPDC090134 TaxID=3364408 RepID=UPI0038138077